MRVIAAAFALVLAACSDRPLTVVDGSSPQAFERSVREARRDLADSDRIVFDRAIRGVGGRRFANRDPKALARTTFDGMTAAEIVADQQRREE